MRKLLTLILALSAGGCASQISDVPEDEALLNLSIIGMQPAVVIPGTRVLVEGRSFVGEAWGSSYVRLEGTFSGDSGSRESAGDDVLLPLTFVDFDHFEFTAGDDLFAGLGGQDGNFVGTASVVIESKVDGRTYESSPLSVSFGVRSQLDPIIGDVLSGNVVFVNGQIQVTGDSFLLGGNEGQSFAVVEGCFLLDGDAVCSETGETLIPLVPQSEFSRTQASFAFVPEIAGIRGGFFDGQVKIRNDHTSGVVLDSINAQVELDLVETTVFGVNPTVASLGQYVFVEGGGFLGSIDADGDGQLDKPGQDTILELLGTYTPDGGSPVPADLVLIPEWVQGDKVRYVLNQNDQLGTTLDLRRDTGTFQGQVVPVVRFAGDELRGTSSNFTLRIAPVKQVVYLKFNPGFVESLRNFGMRAVREQVKSRVVQVIERDYATINLEVRTEEPTDFAKYSIVEINGRDPNGIGLLGYDNTPGKDTNNERLDDVLGGANAQTNEDGFPQFGGVFVESLFAFSKHPGGFADRAEELADEAFDDIFDPFRPDRGGDQIVAADLSGGVTALSDSSQCPASDRASQVECAVYVLGSLIGTTLAHEIGHSLGLASPFGSATTFHNTFDEPNRLMDGGGNRPFTERAELFGDGPGMFCDDWYDYLRNILPTDEPATTFERPTCL